MPLSRKTWQEELEIIDRTMRIISSISDPEDLVEGVLERHRQPDPGE
jgi:hypothetical protein